MKGMFLCYLTVAFFLYGHGEERCVKNAGRVVPEVSVMSDSVPAFSHFFAFGVFEHVCKERRGENVFISPWGIGTLLAMLQNGAVGETQGQILTALALRGYPADYVNGYYKGLTERFTREDSFVRVVCANGIWVDRRYSLKSSFKGFCEDHYDAKAEVVDFQDPLAAVKINDWADRHTMGMIPRVVDGLSSLKRVVMANAVYFKGGWEFPFERKDTRSEYFTNYDSSRVRVQMMNDRFNGLYAEGRDYEGVTMSYKDGGYMMTVLLPKEGKDIQALAHRLYIGSREWEYIRKRTRLREITLKFPKFKINSELSLNDPLRGLGMKLAFSNSADFGGISKKPLWVDEIKHFGSVEVDEEGTEAAAVTMALADGGSDVDAILPRVNFFADRPFLFLIWEKSSGSILFMGKVEKL